MAQYQKDTKPETLGKLYAPFMEMVLAIGLKYFQDRQKAEDLVMKVYEKLVEKAKHHEVNNFSSWLYSLAKNECLMELRKKKREYSTEEFNYQQQFMESEKMLHLFTENKEQAQFSALEACLDELNAEQKLCVEKFYLQNKTYKEIVAETAFDYNRVKSHIQNGKRNLKHCIEEKDGK